MKIPRTRTFFFILVFALLISCIPVSALDVMQFSDWNPSTWYAPAMAWCVKNGYFEGTDKNTIEAERAITRAEYLAVMVRYFHCTGTADISFLSDVSPGDWFYKAISTGYAAGITDGISTTLFAPYRNITREQAFTMYIRALHPVGISLDNLTGYRDVMEVSPWAYDAVSKIVTLDIIEGYEDHTLRPKREITRAEVAQMLYRSCDRTHSEAEQALISAMNSIAPVTISLDTELWASVQTSEAACAISYDSSNTCRATVTLYLNGSDGAKSTELFHTTLRPGETVKWITLKHLPGQGTYPVRFTVSQETGATIRFDAILHVSDP